MPLLQEYVDQLKEASKLSTNTSEEQKTHKRSFGVLDRFVSNTK